MSAPVYALMLRSLYSDVTKSPLFIPEFHFSRCPPPTLYMGRGRQGIAP